MKRVWKNKFGWGIKQISSTFRALVLVTLIQYQSWTNTPSFWVRYWEANTCTPGLNPSNRSIPDVYSDKLHPIKSLSTKTMTFLNTFAIINYFVLNTEIHILMVHFSNELPIDFSFLKRLVCLTRDQVPWCKIMDGNILVSCHVLLLIKGQLLQGIVRSK